MPEPTTHFEDRMLPPKEAAAFLDVKVQTLATWRTGRGPQIPFVKCGRSVKYCRADLVAFLSSRTVKNTTEGFHLDSDSAVKN